MANGTRNGSNGSNFFLVAGLITGLVSSVLYGGWTVFQSQLNNIEKEIYQLRSDTAERDKILRDELSRRETELKTANKNIEDHQESRRKEVLGQVEFQQFEKHMQDTQALVQRQLDAIAQTRPTTGELQASSSALRDRIDRLNGALEALQGKMLDVRQSPK